MVHNDRRIPRLMIAGLIATAGLPRCSCDEEGGIGRPPVEMLLTLVELDPCSGAAVPRRVPDDYQTIAMSTDFGSRAERVFEIRSIGTAALGVTKIELSEPDPEFTIEILDADGNPPALPLEIPADPDRTAPPAVTIKVGFSAEDGESDLIQLVVETDDPDRGEVRFGLSAGNGRLGIQVCDDAGCADAQAIDFANVSQGESATKQLVLKNEGEGDLDLRDIKLETGSGEFCAPEATSLPEGLRDCVPINLCKVLKPGEEYTINITYSPVDGGEDTGVIRVTSGDATTGTVDVPINGVGAGPAVCVCVVEGPNCVPTAAIDFGFAEVGMTIDKTVRLESCGTEPVDLTVAMLETMPGPFLTGPEFAITTPFSTGTLMPSQTTEGVISYTPASSGSHRGGLRYETATSGSPAWISLVGAAATCDIEIAPVSVNFGNVGSGASTDRFVLISNVGALDCEITAITDPADGFSIVQKPAVPLTLGPGASQEIQVRYTAPTRPAAMRDTSSFDVTSDEPAPDDMITVDLSADGGGQAVCAVQVNPSGNSISRDGLLNFGAVNIGYSKTLGIRVTNTGNADCIIQSYSLTTEDPGQISASAVTPLTISPGLAGSIDVTLAPTQGPGGLFPIYLPILNHVDFTLAGPGLVQTDWSIGITGQPTIPTIDIIPQDIDFGLITYQNPQPPDNRSACGSEERSVRIYNSGSGALDIMSIAIDPSSDPVFMITGVFNGGAPVNAPYAMTIQPGGDAEVLVRFFPTRLNPAEHTGLLAVENTVTMLSTVPLRGEATANANQTDTFTQLADNQVDILWVIDDSCSMSEEQSLLANNFAGFVGFADSLGVDYQIGIITTEVNDAPAGKLWACNGFNKILRPSDPNRVAAFQCAANVTSPPSGNSRPNPGGSDEQEAGLQAAKIALEPPVVDTENVGFLRPDARLAVITVSDEEDQSQGSTSLYVDFFRNIKGFRNPQLTTVSAIAGDVPNGCATADAAPRYFDAAGQLGGQFESICTQSWMNMLQNLGLGVFALRTSWTLSRVANPATISVRVNGSPVPMDAVNGWTYDGATNSVSFFNSAIPPPGATIEIQYGAACLP